MVTEYNYIYTEWNRRKGLLETVGMDFENYMTRYEKIAVIEIRPVQILNLNCEIRPIGNPGAAKWENLYGGVCGEIRRIVEQVNSNPEYGLGDRKMRGRVTTPQPVSSWSAFGWMRDVRTGNLERGVRLNSIGVIFSFPYTPSR